VFCNLCDWNSVGGNKMNNPYEKKKRIFTPEVIAELAAANKVAREKKYPFLKDYVPAPVFVDNLRRMK